jgi:hypothetical protein
VGFLETVLGFLGPTGSPKKLPGSLKEAIKNFRAEILTIFSLLFWSKTMTTKRHFEIY